MTRDEETGNYKENIDANIAARERTGEQMIGHYQSHGYGT